MFNANGTINRLNTLQDFRDKERFDKAIHRKYNFWIKLNNSHIDVYLRFQRIFAKKNNGLWIKGFNITFNDFVLK
jgi:hypothetical protein